MQSPVNWALLGLVIERPSYAYELAQRFDRTYEGALSLSSTSHVYTALRALEDARLIEEVPGSGTGRQPKPRYRASDGAIEQYQRVADRPARRGAPPPAAVRDGAGGADERPRRRARRDRRL